MAKLTERHHDGEGAIPVKTSPGCVRRVLHKQPLLCSHTDVLQSEPPLGRRRAFVSVFKAVMARRNHVMSNTIEGKVVVITGASSGLGEATARLLSTQGASVVLGARRVDRIQSLADELTASGGKALAVMTDVTQLDQVKRLVDAAVQSFG